MRKKVLIICNSFPYPVKDGISAAINSLRIRLENDFTVCYYLLNDRSLRNGNFDLCDNLSLMDFDIYCASPINVAYRFISKIPKKTIKIALLSDCYTYVLWRNVVLSFRFNYFGVDQLFAVLKIPVYFFIELYVSLKYNYILLQTRKDKEVFRKIFHLANTIVLPNLITGNIAISSRTDFFKRDGIGWVASFDGSYSKIACVFFKNVVQKVLTLNSQTKLYILGKGSSSFVNDLIQLYPKLSDQIIQEDYYLNIGEFYLKRKIIVCPIYKNYGLINKTIESLYYGCITIGDKAAFNGIHGFVSGVHGFVAERYNDFIQIIDGNLKNEDQFVSNNAVELMRDYNLLNQYPSHYNDFLNELNS